MTHSFKPVTTEQSIQVAILDVLQQIRTLLEPRQEPATMEPAQDVPADVPASAAGEPKQDKPAAKKAPAKKATTRRRVTGQ